MKQSEGREIESAGRRKRRKGRAHSKVAREGADWSVCRWLAAGKVQTDQMEGGDRRDRRKKERRRWKFSAGFPEGLGAGRALGGSIGQRLEAL